jgi:hypothetical protein
VRGYFADAGVLLSLEIIVHFVNIEIGDLYNTNVVAKQFDVIF